MAVKFIKPLSVLILLLLMTLEGQSQKVGLLLGSFVSDRWYLDQKMFTDRLEELGVQCVIEGAYDPEEQLAKAKKMIRDGIQVLVVVPLDGKKAAAIAELGKREGVPVIAYDRLILSNDLTFYISYNNEKVGKLQADYITRQKPNGQYLLINGPTTDNNAILFRQGQLKALDSLVAAGQIKVLKDEILPNWSDINAFEKVKEYFQNNTEIPDAIIVANDALANGVIQALPDLYKGKILVTGQDADLTGIRNILAGYQTMTVYKPIKPLAQKAAEVAVDLLNGVKVKGQTRFLNGNISVEAILMEPIMVDWKNYKETVVSDGHIQLSEAVKNLGKLFEGERDRIQLALLQKERALEREKDENTRNIFIVVIGFFLSTMVGLAFTVFQKQKDNKLLNSQKGVIEKKNQELMSMNDQLKLLNDKLVNQKEEIQAQRDAMSLQKEKLEEVNSIIEAQKEEIQHQNQRLEHEVEKRTGELIQYIRQLEQYSFVTAHSLRAPVARIIGLTQLVKMQNSNPAETMSIIDKLIISSQELDLVFKELNTILDIRTFSMEIFSTVNLEEEVNNILGHLKYEITQNHAVINTDFGDVKSIVSIKPYIHSILFNLLSNAVKYRDLERQPVICVKAGNRDNRIFISVTDNGLGIDPCYMDKVFQLYKRFHFHVEGRGIGLFLVKTQVDSLGGNIELESEVGKGTTVRIWLDNMQSQV